MSTSNGEETGASPQETGANPPTDTLEDAIETGYLGSVADQEANEAYTVEGVTTSPEPSEERVAAGEPSGPPEGGTGPDPEATGETTGKSTDPTATGKSEATGKSGKSSKS
jgi:hypothetical protein